MKDKSGKIIGIIWDKKKSYGTILVASMVLIAVGATVFAYWKTNQMRLSTCHTCGGG